MTNREFAKVDDQFKEACERAGLPATPRQASKWRNGIGAAKLKASAAWQRDKHKGTFDSEGKVKR